MTTAKIRGENHRRAAGSRTQLQERIWQSLAHDGPTTTRGIEERLGIPLLTVRPRVTELVQLGFARLAGKTGHEGIYEACRPEPAPVAEGGRQLALL